MIVDVTVIVRITVIVALEMLNSCIETIHGKGISYRISKMFLRHELFDNLEKKINYML